MSEKKKRFTRFTALSLVVCLILTAIVTRLVVVQIVKADEYKDKANTKAITELQENAPRGLILANDGSPLATNVQSYYLSFADTEDSNSNFFDTMDTVFKILDENTEVQKDDFALKLNPYRFEFKSDDEDTRKALEIRFKRDRGMNEKLQRTMYPDKKEKLTVDEEDAINEKLLEITPEETFKYLVEQYKVSPEGIFAFTVSGYKSNPEEAISRLESRYKVTVDEELKGLLQQYSKTSKQKDKEALLETLAEKCQVSKTKLPEPKEQERERRYMLVKDALKMQSFSGYKPVVIASNIKKETGFIFSQKLNDLPGVDVSMQPMRKYPYGQLGSAVLGYISKLGSAEKYEAKGYDVNTDYIGIQGIEGAFEDRLKGSKGGSIVKLNRYGRVIEELGRRESYPGQTIQLTIDKNVQYATEAALDKTMADLQKKGVQQDVNTVNATRGAAVAIDVNTGAVIALASRPGFNPNDFSDPRGLSTEVFKKYFDPDYVAYGKSRGLSQAMIDKLFPINPKTKKRYDPYDYAPKPLFNYGAYSLVPPGSTFKPMTAIAGLESGAIYPGFSMTDTGVFIGADKKPIPFAVGGYGHVDLTRALAVSSNPFFMTVGDRMLQLSGYKDYDVLAQYAWKFGLGVKPDSGAKATTGIEIGDYFGNVFNTATNRSMYAVNYLYKTMEVLKSGRGSYKAGNFVPIDLYDNDGDIQKLKDLKTEFKEKIKEIIRTGGMVDKETKEDPNKRDSYVLNTYTDYLNKLIALDPQYKGKAIDKKNIPFIAYEMMMIGIYDGYTQSTMPFNMYNAAIGQGISSFTPLQLANYVATLVNGGSRYKLHLVDKIMDSDGKIIQDIKPEVLEHTGIKQTTVDAVKAGMHAVTSGEDGTAAGVFNGFPIETAGKTGSATARSDQEELGRTSYGVYIGFAPYDKPRIAVAILVFDGGHGGFIAPVARAIYEAYFKKELDAVGYHPINEVVAPQPK